jgi:hypothetical protein
MIYLLINYKILPYDGITITRYAKNQNIWKPNNLEAFGKWH